MIIAQITTGLEPSRYETIVHRQEAIFRAISMARSGDTVLIAGKGHEAYQVFKEQTIPFNERKIIQEALV